MSRKTPKTLQFKKYKSRDRHSVAALVLCGFALFPIPSFGQDIDQCYRFELREEDDASLSTEASLGWMTSGHIGSGNRLLLVDIPFKRIASVPYDFRQLKSKRRPYSGIIDQEQDLMKLTATSGGEPFEIKEPAYMRAVSDGRFLLLDRDRQNGNRERLFFVTGDRTYESVVETNNRYYKRVGSLKGDRVWLRAVRRLAPMDKGFVAYVSALPREPQEVDFENEWVARNQWMAFAYIDTEKGTYYQFGRAIEERTTTFEYHFREFEFLTSIEDVGYILRVGLNQPPRIGKVELGNPEIVDLPSFPDGFEFPEAERPEDTLSPRFKVIKWMYQFYRTIEENAVPLGIYSWQNRLFILAKDRMRNGQTDWFLIEVSRRDGREMGRILLPTSAASIVLLLGDPFFAAVEQGSVELIGTFPEYGLYRRAESAVLFPTQWLNALAPAVLKTSKHCEQLF